ncbi:MAG TPA: GNAT family N-acetyltransferase [Burkholderiales bacterium]|nr:GNAT family N-acetyltransferase [Burkholderiales bacterium]
MEIDGYVPGSIGRIVEMHGTYYARNWRLGPVFEAQVARELGELMERFDAARDGFWIAREGGDIAGCIAIDGSRAPDTARLRFFIVDEGRRGAGLGERLMRTALGFCRGAGFRRVFLTTFAGLDAARALYERHGFALAEQKPDSSWGVEIQAQRFELQLQQ